MTQETQALTNLEDFFNEIEEQEFIQTTDFSDDSTPENSNVQEKKEEKPVKKQKESKVKETMTEEVYNSWTYGFKEDKVIKFTEFDLQDYEFHPVHFPDGTFANRFLLFCHEKDAIKGTAKKWKVREYTLSSRYVVASLDSFIKELEKEIKFENVKMYHQPFSISYFGEAKGKSLKTFDKESTAQIFSLMTGIDSDVISNVKTKICLMVSNKYDGTGSLIIDYVLNTSGVINGKEHSFNDYFTLLNITNKINHTSKIKSFNYTLEELEKKAEENRQILKNKTELIEDEMKSISGKLKKELSQKLNSYWEQLPASMRNLYYLQLLVSYCLDVAFDYNSYLNMRKEFCKIF